MDPDVQFVDEMQAAAGRRSVAGAGRAGRGLGRAVLQGPGPRARRCDPTASLTSRSIVLGLDDATLVGRPREMLARLAGRPAQPDAVIMDEAGFQYLWPGEPLRRRARSFEMNDHRAVLVGVCKASQTFQTFPILYTRYSQAMQFVPAGAQR